MKQVHLIHNPTAGGGNHSGEALKAQIEAAGYACRYNSTKQKDWKRSLQEEADIVAIAGGDGTVRKVVTQLLKREAGESNPLLALLPLGTANNFAKTLYGPAVLLQQDTGALIRCWQGGRTKKIDIGRVEHVRKAGFFLEGLGFGMFPYLMKAMKEKEDRFASPGEELKEALKTLHQILLSYEPRHCALQIDGTDHSGKFFMVEVMNIRSIGPNMALAPLADPGDGELEVVMVPEAHLEKFSAFLLHNLTEGDEPYQFHTLKGKKVSLKWDGTRIHADDKMLRQERKQAVEIKINEGVLPFLIPEDDAANG